MRIINLISGDLWAGAEVMTYNLVREQLCCPDLDVSVFILNEGGLAEKLKALPVDLVIANEQTSSFFQLVSSARREVSQRQPQIIHAHRYKGNVLAWLATRGTQTRLVTTQHGLPEASPRNILCKENIVSRLNQWLLSHRFSKVVGVSSTVCEHLQKNISVEYKKLVTIHNGIELPNGLRTHTEGTGLTVGSAGRLFPVKDYALMVDICQKVSLNSPSDRFLLAGDGPEKERLEARINNATMGGHFQLLGHQKDVTEFYSRLDVYINTSEHEGIPMSILEAMAYGLPVVAPDVGGIGEIIDHGVDGFLVSDRKSEAFAEPLEKLRDVELRKRMGIAARKKISEHFSAKSMAASYYDLYTEIYSGL